MAHEPSHPYRHHHHTTHETVELLCAVITVSDTRNLRDDESGALATGLLEAAGFVVGARHVVRDERAEIRVAVENAMLGRARLVVITGGTGIARRDVTIEAIEGLLDKKLQGFGEMFRRLSFDEIGPLAMLSRAVAGTCGNALIVALPGSPAAVKLGIERLIVPIAPHAVALLG